MVVPLCAQLAIVEPDITSNAAPNVEADNLERTGAEHIQSSDLHTLHLTDETTHVKEQCSKILRRASHCSVHGLSPHSTVFTTSMSTCEKCFFISVISSEPYRVPFSWDAIASTLFDTAGVFIT
jgi:hypothetical protein